MSKQRNDTDRRAQVVEACDFAADSETLLRAVEDGAAEVYINRGGRTIARLVPVPYPQGPPWSLYADTLKITGDIVSPLFTDEESDAFLERELENIQGKQPD